MKFALVIGATSDIARHVAMGLAKRGYNLYLTGRNISLLEEIKETILKSYPVSIQNYSLNATDFSSHDSFYTNLSEKPELVMFCLGYYQDQEKAIIDFQESYNTICVNFLSIVSLLNIITNDFAKRKIGNIVVLSSVAGDRGRQLNYIYGSAKAGLNAYLSGLRNRMFKFEVHITTIKLGPVYTKMSSGHKLIPFITLQPENAAEKIIEAGLNKKDEVYIFWTWKYIMFVICSIPEFIFKRMKPF